MHRRFSLTYLLLVLVLLGCASQPAVVGEQSTASVAAPTEPAGPTVPAATPAATDMATPLPEPTVAATATTGPAAPTVTVPPTLTTTPIDGTLVLYSSIVGIPASPDQPPPWDTYWSLRTLPALPYLTADFDVLYGPSENNAPGRYFFNFRPQLSPNGRYLLVPGLASYPEYDVEGTGTWLIDLEAGAARELLSDGVIATWSPTSDAITYVAGDKLYTLNVAEGAAPMPLFQHDGLWPLYAHWSPDGRWIVTMTGVQHEPSGAEGTDLTFTYWLVPPDGEPARELAVRETYGAEYHTSEISWSPDGQFLLMHTLVYDLEGNTLSPEPLGGAEWLAGDSHLLLQRDGGLRTITVAGEEVTRIYTEASGSGAHRLAFSRDGQKLAYTLPRTDEGIAIAVYDMTGGETQIVGTVPGAFYINLLRWSGDDRLLLAEADHGEGRYDIWTLRAEPNGAVERLLPDAELAEVVPYPFPLPTSNPSATPAAAPAEGAPLLIYRPDGHLYRASLRDGSGQQLTAQPLEDADDPDAVGAIVSYRPPVVSPDGRLLALNGHWGGAAALDLTTGQAIGAGRGVAMLAPSWSPDSRALAYVAQDGQLCIYHLDNAPADCIFRSEGLQDAAWSPAGALIAAAVVAPSAEGSADCCAGQVWLVDAAGGEATAIGDYATGFESAPGEAFAWLSDGSGLVIKRTTEGRSALYRIADGSTTYLAEPALSVSPDGRTVLHTSGAVSGADGTARFALPGAGECAGQLSITHAWSPDGSRLAYVLACFAGGGQAAEVSPTLTMVETGNGALLWQQLASDLWPAGWSPDGAYLLLQDNTPNGGAIWRLGAEGGTPERVVEGATLLEVVPPWQE